MQLEPGSAAPVTDVVQGTAGIVLAALGRLDFVAAAEPGAAHLLAVGTLDENGFIVLSQPSSARY